MVDDIRVAMEANQVAEQTALQLLTDMVVFHMQWKDDKFMRETLAQ